MIGLRFWHNDKMMYPTLFSTMTDYEERKSSLRAFIDKKRYDDIQEYMLLTPGIAMNGEIYEQDIICRIGEEDKKGVVEFIPEKGAFIATIDGQDIFIGGELLEYEIVGNTYENKKKSEEKKQEIIKEENTAEKAEEQKQEINPKENIEKKTEEKDVNEKPQKKDVEKMEEKNEQKTIKITPIKSKPLIEQNKPTDKIFGKHPYNSVENTETPKKEEQIEDKKIKREIDEETFFNNTEVSEQPAPPQTLEENIKLQEKPKIRIFFKEEFYPEYSIGKYGFIAADDSFHKTTINQVTDTTENRLQLIMLIDALRSFKKKCSITIICNDKYPTYPFINSWIDAWAKNKWIGSSGNEVRNRDLWEKLYELSQKHEISWNCDTNINKYAEYRLLEEKFLEKKA